MTTFETQTPAMCGSVGTLVRAPVGVETYADVLEPGDHLGTLLDDRLHYGLVRQSTPHLERIPCMMLEIVLTIDRGCDASLRSIRVGSLIHILLDQKDLSSGCGGLQCGSRTSRTPAHDEHWPSQNREMLGLEGQQIPGAGRTPEFQRGSLIARHTESLSGRPAASDGFPETSTGDCAEKKPKNTRTNPCNKPNLSLPYKA